VQVLRLGENRILTRIGALVLERGKRSSPLIYVRSAVVGNEGVCLPSRYSASAFWLALRVESIDPRITSRVIRPRQGLEILPTAERSWEIRGPNGALRAWLLDHLRAVEDAHRNFIDLPTITYATRTSLGWSPGDPDALARLARSGDILDRDEPPTLVGWRWSEFEVIGYFRVWPDSTPTDAQIAQAIQENDHYVRRAISRSIGLAPGPCPILGPGKPLLAPPPR
jgi:hypothetical protein